MRIQLSGAGIAGGVLGERSASSTSAAGVALLEPVAVRLTLLDAPASGAPPSLSSYAP